MGSNDQLKELAIEFLAKYLKACECQTFHEHTTATLYLLGTCVVWVQGAVGSNNTARLLAAALETAEKNNEHGA